MTASANDTYRIIDVIGMSGDFNSLAPGVFILNVILEKQI